MLANSDKLGAVDSKTTDISNELAKACFELARTAKWTQRPIDTDEIVRLAERYLEITLSHLSTELRIDVPLLTRAVRYIILAHGTPHGDDTHWFETILTALIEVARPNSGLANDGKEFLKDMLDGIEESLLD
jgi:hypothetical protein